MKKILLSLVLFINAAMATMSSFSIDKNEVDYARNELLSVNFKTTGIQPGVRVEYHLYLGENGQVFLDIYSPTDDDFPISFPRLNFTVPLALQSLTGNFLLPGETKMVILNVREVLPSNSGIVQSQQFSILAKNTMPNNYTQVSITDPTGAWFDPALNGVGFVLMQVENGSVMYYYGYDDGGKRLWLLSEVIDETWIKGEAKTLVMYEGKADANTNFTTPPGTAPGTVEWGSVEMRFDDCNSGFAKLSGADGEQIFTLTKLAVPSALHCTIQ